MKDPGEMQDGDKQPADATAGGSHEIEPVAEADGAAARPDPVASEVLRAEELEAALAAAKAESAIHKDHWLRAVAEMENVRRRTQREAEDTRKYATAQFAKDLLAIADNLGRALAAIPKEALEADEQLRNFATGVELTERLLLGAFEKNNLQRIDPLGEKFDSHRHQALFEVPGTGQPAGTVVQVMESGYILHDRLLRPALVGIAKAEPAADPAKPANGGDAG